MNKEDAECLVEVSALLAQLVAYGKKDLYALADRGEAELSDIITEANRLKRALYKFNKAAKGVV